MLGPHFREGTALVVTSAPVELPLPDDDPSAMRIFCSVLHLAYDNVPGRREDPDFDRLLGIAMLVDEYDCATAFSPSAYCWIPTA